MYLICCDFATAISSWLKDACVLTISNFTEKSSLIRNSNFSYFSIPPILLLSQTEVENVSG